MAHSAVLLCSLSLLCLIMIGDDLRKDNIYGMYFTCRSGPCCCYG